MGDYLENERKLVWRGRRTWQYKLISGIARELGWPRRFRRDLTWWDAMVIGDLDPQEFLWAIAPDGTKIVVRDSTVTPRSLLMSKALYFHIANGIVEQVTEDAVRDWTW